MSRNISGSFILEPQSSNYGFVPVYFAGRQVDDSQVWTSPLFISAES